MYLSDPAELLRVILIWILPIVFALTLHEFAHALAADRLGDPTARSLGRLSLNPICHISLIGTLLIPLILLNLTGFLIGWAKPIPINTRNLRSLKRDTAIIAAAGIAANLIMLLFWALIAKFTSIFNTSSNFFLAFQLMGFAGIYTNTILIVINILPVPPLDGSRIISSLIPQKINYYYEKLEPFGFLILVILIFTRILPLIISPLMRGIFSIIGSTFQISL